MSRARSIVLAAMICVLAGVLATGGQTGQKPKDPPKKNGKKDDELYFARFEDAPSSDATVYYPVPVTVYYETNQDGQWVMANNPGKNNGSVVAPKTMGTKPFDLDFNGDTTGTAIQARIHPNDPPKWWHEEERQGINFLNPNGMAYQKGDPYTFESYPEGALPAKKAAKPGDPIAPGLHWGEFPLQPAYMHGAHARIWIRARYVATPTAKAELMKTDYDLSAVLIQRPNKGKWQPVWYIIVREELKAFPRPFDGAQKPKTLMQAVLLDGKGKVIHLMDHKH